MVSPRSNASRDIEDHVGHVLIGERTLGATLSQSSGRLSLHVALGAGEGLDLPRDCLVQFRAATGYFTLLGLREGTSHMLLGVAGSATLSVHHAIKSANFTSLDDIRSATWMLYVEDLPEIHHVNGFVPDFAFGHGAAAHVSWSYSPPGMVTLDCPTSGLQVALGQDFRTSSDTRDQAVMTFAYPMTVTFAEAVGLYDALPVLHRIRQFCSLMMGRVLDIERVVLRMPQEGGRSHDAEVFGVHPVKRSDRPEHRIARFADPAALAALLDTWLDRADALEEAIDLHFEALEKEDLGLPLRFQQFVQAIEAAHRRSGAPVGDPINVDVVVETLRERGVADGMVDRVRGMLAHAHEPGLRQRLRAYWDALVPELAVLRPDLKRNAFVDRLVTTRNFYAHGLDMSPEVLKHADLWDGVEFLKAVSHLVLLQAIGADVSGVGQRMLDERFVQFAIRP
jgi:hypothetical protein